MMYFLVLLECLNVSSDSMVMANAADDPEFPELKATYRQYFRENARFRDRKSVV